MSLRVLYCGIASVEFEYSAQTDEELSVQEGEQVWILEQEDQEWWKVKIKTATPNPDQERIGLVPASYLTAPVPLRTVHALYDYDPPLTVTGEYENEEELQIKEGETLALWEEEGDWVLVGRLGLEKAVGFVPASYIEDGEAEAQEEAPEEEEREVAVPSPTAAAYVDPSERVAAVKAASASKPKAGEVKTWSVTEMDKKKKKKKGTLGVGNGAIFFASESDKTPVQQYPLSTLTDLRSEKSKHLHLTFPSSTTGELHFIIPSKEAFDEIVAKIEEGRSSSEEAESTAAAPVARKLPPLTSSAPRFNDQAGGVYVPPPPPLRRTTTAGSSTSVSFQPPPRSTPTRAEEEEHQEEHDEVDEEEDEQGGDAVALYDFDPQGEDELAIVEGERLFVVKGEGESDDPDWIKVRKLKGGSEGVVPASYIQHDDEAGGDANGYSDTQAQEAAEEQARLDAEAASLQQQQQQKRGAAASARAIKLEAERDAQLRRRQEEQDDRSPAPAPTIPPPPPIAVTSRETKREQAADRARRERIAAAGPATPIPVPQRGDAEEPPRLAQRPGRESRSEGTSGSGGRSKDGTKKPAAHRVRTWKDRTGQFKVEAEFLGLNGNKIRLHKLNGVIIEVPVEKMSGEDTAYIKKVTSRSSTRDDNDDDVPLSQISNQEDRRNERHRRGEAAAEGVSGPRPTTSSRSSQAPKKQTDWFEFFLNAGCDVDDCTRYGNNFQRERIEEGLIAEIEASTLRTLGLREGDIIRVMKHIREKYAPPTPSKSDRDVQIASDALMARSIQEPTPPPPNLFTGPDGGLKTTRRGRPAPSRSGTGVVDSAALANAGATLVAQRTATPPISSSASTGDLLGRSRSNSTVPLSSGGFDDDAWQVRPSSAKPAVSSPPAITPIQPPMASPQELPRSTSTGPSNKTSTLSYNDGLLAQLGIGPRPPSAPVSSAPGGGSYSSVPAVSGPRPPIAPVPINQQLLAPLVPDRTGMFGGGQQRALMPNLTGYPGMNNQQFGGGMQMGMQNQQYAMSPSHGFLQQPPPQPNNFLLQAQQTGFAPLQPQQTGYAPMQQQQQTGYLQAQPTGFSSGFSTPNSQFGPAPPMPTIKFNPMPPPAVSSPPPSTAAPQYQAGSIFSKMKDGTFANPNAPQDPTKYDALRPQPTGMPAFSQGGFAGQMQMQPQMTGFQQPQMTGFQQPQQLFSQPTGMPMPYGQNGYPQQRQQF